MFDFERGKIRFIRGGKYPQSNSVLIDDDVRAIIDPACDEEKLRAVHAERAVGVIINSHGHEDHLLYNYLLTGAKLWVHALDAGVYKNIEAFIDQFFAPAGVDEEMAAGWFQFMNEVVKFQPREPDRLLEDGELLDFGETRVQVLHTPGHSPGHLSFHFLNEKVIFMADLDLVKFGPYYGDKASSIDDTIASLKRLAEIEADVYLVSHGKEGILDGDPAHIERYLGVIYRREGELLDFLATGPKTIEEITGHGIIYGGHKLASGAWDLSISEMAMMIKHVERLERLNRVRKEEGRYHLIS